MKTKKVNRYYCDYCQKSGGAAGHIRRHESACTMNPNRVCRTCLLMEATQAKMEDLIAILPNAELHKTDSDDYSPTLTVAANEVLPKLRKAANNCPACILAAIRQAHIPVPMVTDFDFAAELRRAATKERPV